MTTIEETDTYEPAKAKRKAGFAAMDRETVQAFGRLGGRAAHAAGTAHRFTKEEAAIAGSKGGKAVHAKRAREKAGA